MNPVEHRLPVNGITLTYFEWNARRRDEGSVLLAHATGFHARCWDQVARQLDDRHVIAVDQRGHGRSAAEPPEHWRVFGDDLAEFIRAIDLDDIVGVGHSMGGHAMTQAAALEPQRFESLLLIDPVILPPETYAAVAAAGGRMPGQHPTAKRRNQWASADEMFERFKERTPFDTWDRAVLRDYCEFGLLPDPARAGYVLACQPRFEAEVYMTSASNGPILDHVRSVYHSVQVVRAMQPPPGHSIADFRYSPTWPGVASEFPRGRDLQLPEYTHFLPMEAPAFVARLIREATV